MDEDVLAVNTRLKITKPVHEIFEAVVDPKKMSRYFITTGSDRMATGKTIHWTWADVGAELDVRVKKVEPDRHISFLWTASGADSLVELRLEPAGDDATVVWVSESGWPPDAEGITRCIEQTAGWVHFLCCLKAFLEHGIDLRTGGVVDGGLTRSADAPRGDLI
jgi:uncharacterized protein YndB with AHSA1/START domain